MSGSAFAGEGITFCFVTSVCAASGHINGRSRTFALIVIGTFLSFTVDVDFFTAAVMSFAVCHTGRLKLGMDIVLEDGADVPAAGLRTPNGVVLLLVPNGVVFAAVSDNPVAITVILA